MKDKENIVDVGILHIPSQRASAVSFRQHVAEQRHPGNMRLNIVTKQNYDLTKFEFIQKK